MTVTPFGSAVAGRLGTGPLTTFQPHRLEDEIVDPPDEEGYDLIVLAGQSNMDGAGTPIDPVIDVGDPRIWTYPAQGPDIGELVLGVDPLKHPAPSPSAAVGPGMPFARAWVAEVSSPRRVLLVPCAIGGTGLSGGPWAVGGERYNFAVSHTLAALAAAGEGSRVAAVLWSQGENDAVRNISQSSYAVAFDAMMDGFRAEFDEPHLPVILAGMVPEWRAAPNGSSLAIHAAHIDTPNRDPYALFVDGPGTGYGQDSGGIHWNIAAQRLIGEAMADAYFAPQAAPTAPTGLTATPADGTVLLTWTAPAGTYPGTSDYIVQYRPTGSGPWTTVTDDVSHVPSGAVGGLVNGTPYDFRVAAVNAIDQGPFSDVESATPAVSVSDYETLTLASSSLLCYFPFDELTAPPVDQAGLVTSPIVSGSIVWGAPGIGDRDTAADFAGAIVHLGTPAELLTAGPLTIETLIEPDGVGGYQVIVARDDLGTTSGQAWRLSMVTGQIEFYRFSGSTYYRAYGDTVLTPEERAHVAAVFDGSHMKLYVNGVLDCPQVAAPGAMNSTTRPIGVGRTTAASSGNHYPFLGRIAGLAFHGAALSAAEVYAKAQSAAAA